VKQQQIQSAGNIDVLQNDCQDIDQKINHFLMTRLSHIKNDSAMHIPPLGAILHRMIIDMPSKEKVAACLLSAQASDYLAPSTQLKKNPSSQDVSSSSAEQSIREKSVFVQLDEAKKMIFYGDNSDQLRDEITEYRDIPWTVHQDDSLSYEEAIATDSADLLNELTTKQKQLLALENENEPRLRKLLGQVIGECIRYDSKSSSKIRATREEYLDIYEKLMETKKSLITALQKQQQYDMNAICDVCNDTESSENICNRTVICESCNVAVHQMCYGIESIPEGDWFCRACLYFNRHEIGRDRSEAEMTEANLPKPLPSICCELCPRKQGAFVRTEDKQHPSVAKWVHVMCAKWHSLNYLDTERQECVESVDELKTYFNDMGISCFLCEGMRGAFHQCSHEKCQRFQCR